MQQEHIIDVLLFGADLPKIGLPAKCTITQAAIHLDFQLLKIPFSDLSAEVGGFNHDQLQLHWQNDNADYMLMPANLANQKTMRTALPTDQVQGLKKWHKSTSSQSLVWQSVWYGAGFLALMLGLIIWQYDRVLTWAANQVSMETEKKLGDSVLQSISNSDKFLKTGVAVDAVKKIGKQLTQGSRYQYEWYVVQDNTINAFAAPGGIIVVNSGLLKKAEANELAAVLSHEIQHVEQRHSLKNMLNSAGIASVVLVVLGDANAVMMVMAQQISQQYFSRQVEADADLKGAQLLTKHNINPSGMPSFFKKMEAEYQAKFKGKDAMPGWLSSHPDTLERIRKAEAYVMQHPCKTCVTLVWDKPAILAELAKKRDEDDSE